MSRPELSPKQAALDAFLIMVLTACSMEGVVPPTGEGSETETPRATETAEIPTGEANYIPDLSELVTLPGGEAVQTLLDQSVELAKTIPGMEGVETPVIGLFEWKDGTSGESETMGFTINPETQQNYLLYRSELMAGLETGHEEMAAPYYGRAVMGEKGEIASASYYYVDSMGENVEVFSWDGSKTEYIKVSGERVDVDVNVVSGEQMQGTGRLLSLIPNLTAEFYFDLPTGSVIDPENNQIVDIDGNLLYDLVNGVPKEPQVDLTSLVEPGQEIREVNGYQTVGYEKTWDYPLFSGGYELFVKTEFRLMVVQGEEETYRVNSGQVEQYQGGKWEVMEWPEGVRPAEFFDIKDIDGDGKPEIYGIDEYGIAVANIQNGQWQKFTREIRGLEDGDLSVNGAKETNEVYARWRVDPSIIAEPILDEVLRLTGPDGEPLYWDGWTRLCNNNQNGDQQDCKIGEGGSMVPGTGGRVDMPAVIKGVYPWKNNSLEVMLIELPRRYERQISMIFLQTTPGYTNSFSCMTVGDGNDWSRRKSIGLSSVGLKQLEWVKAYLQAVETGEAPQYQVLARISMIDYDWEGYLRTRNITGYERMESFMADEATSKMNAFGGVYTLVVPSELAQFVR